MRIISGNFKGRKLIEPIDKKTRPLKDLTKESIFNILEHSNLVKTKINNSKVSNRLEIHHSLERSTPTILKVKKIGYNSRRKSH